MEVVTSERCSLQSAKIPRTTVKHPAARIPFSERQDGSGRARLEGGRTKSTPVDFGT